MGVRSAIFSVRVKRTSFILRLGGAEAIPPAGFCRYIIFYSFFVSHMPSDSSHTEHWKYNFSRPMFGGTPIAVDQIIDRKISVMTDESLFREFFIVLQVRAARPKNDGFSKVRSDRSAWSRLLRRPRPKTRPRCEFFMFFKYRVKPETSARDNYRRVGKEFNFDMYKPAGRLNFGYVYLP